jgi:glycosyltransferase involved in cell wall biosynthesis
MSDWLVVHEIGAPSHYEALRHVLQQQGQELEFVELGFWLQVKAMLRLRLPQFAKTAHNIRRVLQFSFDGARGRRVVLGLAPYNPWLFIVRWLLRHAEIALHSSWPYWDGSKQPHHPLLPGVKPLWRRFMTTEVRHVLIATRLAQRNLSLSEFAGPPVTVVAHSFDARLFFVGPAPDGAPQRLIYIGRLEVSKGIDLILEIAAREPLCEIVIVGGGPMVEQVRQAATRMPNLLYLGILHDRAQLGDELRRSQVLLLPSIRVATWEELFGMVLIEGMACGLVPLTTDHVGPKEILGESLESMCFSESGYVDGVCHQLATWRANPSVYLRQRDAALALAAPYTRERIAKRWAQALGISGDVR